MSASALQDPALLQQPALSPPPGVIPNFTNPEDNGRSLIIVGAILLAFMFIGLANRAYIKACVVRKTSWDDMTLCLSAIGACVSYGICVWAIHLGVIGRHQYDLRYGDILSESSSISSYVLLILSGPTLWVTKFTFSLLYLQIFRPMRWLVMCIYVGITVFTVFYWSLSIIFIVLASPRPGETWGEAETSPRLAIVTKLAVLFAAGGMLVDVWLFALPLVAIYKLQLHRTRRIGLTIMFSTGLIAVAASAVSIFFRRKFQYTEDKAWIKLDVYIVFLIEVDAGIITACMPAFAKMLHHHLPPWARLKSSLKFIDLASPRDGSKRNLVTFSKDSRPIRINNQDNNQIDIPYVNRTELFADIELECQNPAKAYITGAASETFDDDRIYLKQDAQQT